MLENQGRAKMHRYYVIENGNHVDPFYNLYLPQGPSVLRRVQGGVRGALGAPRL